MSDSELRLKSHLLESDEPQHNAAEDRIVSNRVHQFYHVKLWSYEDPQLKGQIEENENLVNKLGQEKIQISEKIAEREREISELKSLLNYNYWRFGDGERVDKMRHLQFILDKLNFANNAYQGRPTKSKIRFSGGEFDKHKFQFRMLHGTKNLAEEKQILREIKPRRQDVGNSHVTLEQLEKKLSHRQHSWFCSISDCKNCIAIAKEHKLTRERAIASASVKGKIWNSLGSKPDLQNQLKFISSEVDELRRVHLEFRSKIKRAEFKIAKPEKDIKFLKQKLHGINKTKDEAHQRILELRTQICDENVCYDQYVLLFANAEKLAQAKDVEALAKTSHTEVEKFMSKWNNSKAFRDDYVRRVSCSVESRGLSRDGRVKNPNEEVVRSTKENVKLNRPLRRKMKWKNPTKDSD